MSDVRTLHPTKAGPVAYGITVRFWAGLEYMKTDSVPRWTGSDASHHCCHAMCLGVIWVGVTGPP
jgi:hypothetical protein